MKVCTDSCLFGAWVSSYIEEQKIEIKNALEIGVGTGLLSLMIAQKTIGRIYGVEIDRHAYEQAMDNINQSPYYKRCEVENIALQDYIPDKKFDFIFSNPPFFEGDLKSIEAEKNNAKHDTSLTLVQLILFISKNISSNGLAAMLIPFQRLSTVKIILEQNGLYLIQETLVRTTTKSDFFRAMLLFSPVQGSLSVNEISIHDEHRKYTDPFKDLLKDYYLYL